MKSVISNIFITFFERHVLERNSFGVVEIPDEFKNDLATLYDTIVENYEESEYIVELKQSMGNLDTDFLGNIDIELNKESDLAKLQALSVLEYTHFFRLNLNLYD